MCQRLTGRKVETANDITKDEAARRHRVSFQTAQLEEGCMIWLHPVSKRTGSPDLLKFRTRNLGHHPLFCYIPLLGFSLSPPS
jgi:hypothetical protein